MQHKPSEFPHIFYGKTQVACQQQARRAGWRLCRNGATMCPRCPKATGEPRY